MGINNHLQEMLTENKLDDRLAASKLSDEDKAKVKEMNDSLVNKTKYVDFLMKHYEEDGIVDLINNFEKNVHKLPQKDILAYSIGDLRDLAKGKIKSKTDVKKETFKDAEKVFEDDEMVIYCPKTYDASCLLGKGTKWCIASKTTDQHWQSYTGSRIKFYVIFRKDLKEDNPLYKVAVSVYPDGKKEAYDAEDRKMDKLPEFLQ
jgi:hypothetical protein